MADKERQSAVAAAVWPWRDRKQEAVDEAPARRRHSLIEAAVGATVGLILLFVFHHKIVAIVVFSIAGIVLVSGQFVPPVYKAFKKGGMLLAKGVGIALSWLLLAPFFYICFTIGRIALTLSGKDPLARRCPSDEKTYWAEHAPISGPEHYTRQYRIEV